jgi:hypothetical protein
MGERWSLVDACRSVGLDCRCEHRPGEPRFRLGIDHGRSRPLLYLTLRNDDALCPQPIHADPEVPGVFFEVAERTLARDPAPGGAWLPCTRRHRFVVWREAEGWRVERLHGANPTATVAEVVAHAAARQRTRG